MTEVPTLGCNYSSHFRHKKHRKHRKRYSQNKQPYRYNSEKFYKKIFKYNFNKQKGRKTFKKGKRVYKRNKTCKCFLCGKEGHIKPHYPDSDSICIISSSESNTSSNSDLERNFEIESDVELNV